MTLPDLSVGKSMGKPLGKSVGNSLANNECCQLSEGSGPNRWK